MPQKLFEVSDTVVKDASSDTGAKNVRKIAAMGIDTSSNFEVIHGLIDLIMTKVGADFSKRDYKLTEDNDDPRFFPTRGFSLMLKGKKIGSVGVLHPEVLGNFELKYPVSALEIDFDQLFAHFRGEEVKEEALQSQSRVQARPPPNKNDLNLHTNSVRNIHVNMC